MMERPKQDESEDRQNQSQPAQNHDHARDDHHQPLEKGIDSDHIGTPDLPEEDNMDEDRGA